MEADPLQFPLQSTFTVLFMLTFRADVVILMVSVRGQTPVPDTLTTYSVVLFTVAIGVALLGSSSPVVGVQV